MSQIRISDEKIYVKLVKQAKKNHRSAEKELLSILEVVLV